jgi:hypothetical protein
MTATPRARALRPGFASLAIVAGVPLGHGLRSALTILDSAPVALGAAVTLLPALSLFAVAAIAFDLADLPLVTATRRWVTDHGFRPRPRRTQ